jgi:hypothetical protein
MSNKILESLLQEKELEGPILHINVEEMPVLYSLFKPTIKKYGDYYMSFANSDPIIQDDFRKVTNLVMEVDRESRTKTYKDSQGRTVNYTLNHKGGGLSDPSSVCGIGIGATKQVVSILLYKHYMGRYYQPPNSDDVGVEQNNEHREQNNEHRGGFIGPLSPFSMGPPTPFSMLGSSSYKQHTCNQIHNQVSKAIGREHEFPIYDRSKGVPSVDKILEKILPTGMIASTQDKAQDVQSYIETTSAALKHIEMVLSVFDNTSGNVAVKIVKSFGLFIGGVVAAIGTGGAGGDNAVAAGPAVAKAVSLITKLFTKVSKILLKLSKLKRLIPLAQKGLDIAIPVLDKTGKMVEKGSKLLTDPEFQREKIEEINTQLFFLMDLFSVDFRGGPEYLRCWIEYIMAGYLQTTENISGIKSILCLINEIYTTINDTLISFIGSAIDVAIPDTMNLGGILAPLFSSMASKIYDKGVYQAESYWDRIPPEARDRIEDPEYLEETFNYYVSMFIDITEKQSQEQGIEGEKRSKLVSALTTMRSGIGMAAYAANKGFSLLFLFINLFSIFANLNEYSRNKYTDVDVKYILQNECPQIIAAGEKFIKQAKGIAKTAKIKSKQMTGSDQQFASRAEQMKYVKGQVAAEGTVAARKVEKVARERGAEYAVQAQKYIEEDHDRRHKEIQEQRERQAIAQEESRRRHEERMRTRMDRPVVRPTDPSQRRPMTRPPITHEVDISYMNPNTLPVPKNVLSGIFMGVLKDNFGDEIKRVNETYDMSHEDADALTRELFDIALKSQSRNKQGEVNKQAMVSTMTVAFDRLFATHPPTVGGSQTSSKSQN